MQQDTGSRQISWLSFFVLFFLFISVVTVLQVASPRDFPGSYSEDNDFFVFFFGGKGALLTRLILFILTDTVFLLPS